MSTCLKLGEVRYFSLSDDLRVYKLSIRPLKSYYKTYEVVSDCPLLYNVFPDSLQEIRRYCLKFLSRSDVWEVKKNKFETKGGDEHGF